MNFQPLKKGTALAEKQNPSAVGINVHLMFMQLTSRASLRGGIQSLTSRVRNLYHLGAKPVSRSTFLDANAKRPGSFYEALFQKIYSRCQPIAPKHKFKLKSNLYSIWSVLMMFRFLPGMYFKRERFGNHIFRTIQNTSLLTLYAQNVPKSFIRLIREEVQDEEPKSKRCVLTNYK